MKLWNFLSFAISKISDVVFKVVSWIVLIGLVRFAYVELDIYYLLILDIVLTALLGFSLMVYSLRLILGDPADFDVPEKYHGIARIVQFLLGLVVVLSMSVPFGILDGVINAFVEIER